MHADDDGRTNEEEEMIILMNTMNNYIAANFVVRIILSMEETREEG